MQYATRIDVNYLIFIMVTGALLLAAIYHSILYHYNRFNLIGHYSVYVWAVFVYCFSRCLFFNYMPDTPYFSIDEVLQMVAFALYVRFTSVALELNPTDDRLSYWYSKVAPIVVGCYIVIHGLFFWLNGQHIIGAVPGNIAYILIRAFLLFVGFISLVSVFGKRNNIYFRYIFYGILSIIIIGFAATLEELFWKYKTPINALTVMAIGYNLDLILFSAAISYKISEETIEKEKANQRVLEQEIELQKNNMERLILSFKAKEEERTRIATELHDEIGSTISSISILSDVITREKNETSKGTMQEEIKNNSKQVMDKMDDIIWSLNPRNDSMEQMLLRLKQFATPVFEAKNINYAYNVNNAIYALQIPMEHRQHIYLIMKEAVNNLVKYADCDEARLTVNTDNESAHFMLHDNGVGFLVGEHSEGNGLHNMRRRAEAIGALLEIDSVTGSGTKVHLSLKIV